MYYFPEPPYFLLFAALLASMTSGAAFSAVLKQSVQSWSKTRSTRALAILQGPELILPFLGIAIGSCVFLSSGMTVFGFPSSLAYLIAIPMTAIISLLIWVQLGQILVQLEQGGSQALDLDSFF